MRPEYSSPVAVRVTPAPDMHLCSCAHVCRTGAPFCDCQPGKPPARIHASMVERVSLNTGMTMHPGMPHHQQAECSAFHRLIKGSARDAQ